MGMGHGMLYKKFARLLARSYTETVLLANGIDQTLGVSPNTFSDLAMAEPIPTFPARLVRSLSAHMRSS